MCGTHLSSVLGLQTNANVSSFGHPRHFILFPCKGGSVNGLLSILTFSDTVEQCTIKASTDATFNPTRRADNSPLALGRIVVSGYVEEEEKHQ